MKIYTLNFNCSQPSLQRLSIPNFSDVKIGVKVYRNDAKLPLTQNEVSIVDGDKTIAAEGIHAGYIILPMTTTDVIKEYTIRVKTTVYSHDFKLVVNPIVTSVLEV